MPELQIDLTVANRFISSLSKSLQALCHGCMDFDSGIEIVGYININIDSGSKVDYVLNEKVLKSTTNSMTFVSNSFLAKKEQPKQTRDGACSPIPQPHVAPYVPRMPPAYLNSRFQKVGSPYSQNVKGPQKRPRADDLTLSHKKYHLQSHSAESPAAAGQTSHSHLISASASSSYTDVHSKQSLADNSVTDSTQVLQVNIKKETLEMDSENNFDGEHSHHPPDDQNLDSSLNQADTVQVKHDPDETNSGSGNAVSNNDSDNAVTSESADFKGNFLEPPLNDNQQPAEESCDQSESESHRSPGMGSEVGSKEHSLADGVNKPSTSRVNIADTDADMSSEHEPASGVSVDYDKSGDDGSYYQPGYEEAGEGSSDTGQFEVIEIDDEDEDVQAMFGNHRVYHRRHHHSGRLSSEFSGQSFSAVSAHRLEMSANTHERVACDPTWPGTTTCPHCSQEFPASHFKIHMSKCHGSLMPFTCTLCDRGYETQLGLRRHVDLHEGRKTNCPICGRSFSLSFNLRRHMKLVHGSSQCPKCLAIFKADNEFNLHLVQCRS